MKKARLLHTMLRVGDLQRSIDFYCGIMGMQVMRSFDQPKDKFSLTFLGYGDESKTCVGSITFCVGSAPWGVCDQVFLEHNI